MHRVPNTNRKKRKHGSRAPSQPHACYDTINQSPKCGHCRMRRKSEKCGGIGQKNATFLAPHLPAPPSGPPPFGCLFFHALFFHLVVIFFDKEVRRLEHKNCPTLVPKSVWPKSASAVQMGARVEKLTTMAELFAARQALESQGTGTKMLRVTNYVR